MSERGLDLKHVLGAVILVVSLFGSQHFVDSYYNAAVAKYHDAGQPLPTELQEWVDLQAQQKGRKEEIAQGYSRRARSMQSVIDAGQDIAFGVRNRGVDSSSK